MTQNRNIVNLPSIIWIIVVIAAGYVVIVALMYLFQSAFVYFPTRNIVTTPEIRDMEYEDVWLYTDDEVRLHGWFIPSERDLGTLLFSHGNAGNISGRIESISQFHKLGMNVFIFDYRGYGKSNGRPSEEGTYRDAEAAWRYLTEVREIPPERIILFGRSLGAGVAAWLASHIQAGGLALESTFTSAADLAGDLYPFIPVRLLMHIRYPVLEYMESVSMPVMVAHSRNDEVIPYQHGKKVYEKAGEPKKWLELQGGHNDGFILTGQAYMHAWEEFINMALDGLQGS